MFDESIALYHDMAVSEKWTDRNEVHVPVFQGLTHKVCFAHSDLKCSFHSSIQFALLVIEKCGFGVSFKWSAPPEASDGSMSLQKAMEVVNDSYTLMVFAPWLMSLPLAR